MNDSNVADLSDVTLEIKTGSLTDVCNSWESSMNSIDLGSIDVKSAFKPLTDNGVGVSYIECLQNSFDAGQSLILSTSTAIKNTVEEQTGVDSKFADDYNGGGGVRNPQGTNDTSKNDGTQELVSDTKVPTEEAVPDTGIPIDQIEQEKLEINKDFVDKINSLDANSYITFMTALSSISNNNLLGLLVDENYASELKKALLASPNLSEDLKKLISEMDENEVQVSLQSILTDNINLSDTSKNIIYSYTESLSKTTNLDILKVTKEEQFFKNVDELSTAINTLLNKENFQEELLNIYDGAGENENIVEFARIAVDKIAEKSNTNYEDLLSNKAHEESLKNELSNLSKSLTYFKTVNGLGTEAAKIIYESAIS